MCIRDSTGGAPGSTEGGMKVTTLAVLIANAVAAFRRREDPQLFHRRLETSTAVSYTHLDVYKRQAIHIAPITG